MLRVWSGKRKVPKETLKRIGHLVFKAGRMTT
jgi:hypothetical protein